MGGLRVGTMEKRAEILDYIRSYTDKHGYPPSMVEMMEGCEIASKSTIYHHLQSMAKDGLITWEPGKNRTVRVLVPTEKEKTAQAGLAELLTAIGAKTVKGAIDLIHEYKRRANAL